MPAPELTPVQSALLTAMREAIVPGKYTNYFQATFLPDVPPTIAFFARQGCGIPRAGDRGQLPCPCPAWRYHDHSPRGWRLLGTSHRGLARGVQEVAACAILVARHARKPAGSDNYALCPLSCLTRGPCLVALEALRALRAWRHCTQSLSPLR